MRHSTLRLGMALLCLAGAGLLLTGGTALLLWAAYQFASQFLGSLAAAALVGSLLIAVGGMLAWWSTRLNR